MRRGRKAVGPDALKSTKKWALVDPLVVRRRPVDWWRGASGAARVQGGTGSSRRSPCGWPLRTTRRRMPRCWLVNPPDGRPFARKPGLCSAA